MGAMTAEIKALRMEAKKLGLKNFVFMNEDELRAKIAEVKAAMGENSEGVEAVAEVPSDVDVVIGTPVDDQNDDPVRTPARQVKTATKKEIEQVFTVDRKESGEWVVNQHRVSDGAHQVEEQGGTYKTFSEAAAAAKKMGKVITGNPHPGIRFSQYDADFERVQKPLGRYLGEVEIKRYL